MTSALTAGLSPLCTSHKISERGMPILNERDREERNEMRKTRRHYTLGFVLLNSLTIYCSSVLKS